MEQFVLLAWLERVTGIESSSWVLLLTGAVFIANFITRIIPDDAIGWRAVVKKITKLIGLYASNRVTSGVSVNDVSKVLLDAKQTTRGESGKFIATETVEDLARKLK